MSFGVSDPSKGHLRSHEEVMGKLQFFCKVTLRKKSLRRGNGVTESLSSRRIDTYAT